MTFLSGDGWMTHWNVAQPFILSLPKGPRLGVGAAPKPFGPAARSQSDRRGGHKA
jgi:hypothetical protein